MSMTGPRGGAEPDFKYDVCLSFAGEQRGYVAEVADRLRALGVRVFYDEAEQVTLWGRDLYIHLDWIYRRAARYCVLFASEQYAAKVWPSHERASAQARALEENAEYILPVRFDDAEIPGLRPTVGYLDAMKVSPEELAKAIVAKLGPRVRQNYLPPVPDKLYDALELSANEEIVVNLRAESLMTSLMRMTVEERRALVTAFRLGCPTELPDDIHVSVDLLRRETDTAPAEIVELLRGLGSLGVEVSLRKGHDDDDDEEMVVIEWHDRTIYDDEIADPTDGSILDSACGAGIIKAIVSILVEERCNQCIENAVEHLDFGFLASSTAGHE